jgi:hypothetical protein
MKFRAMFFSVIILVALLAAAGCFGTTPEKPATPAPTPEPTPEITETATPQQAPTASTKPGPTDTLPPVWQLSISVEKAGTYSKTIIAHFDGGKGQIAVMKIDVRVTRSDGTVETKPLKTLNGEVAEIEGTSGTDRVEVIVTMNSGVAYKIIDQQMPYKSRG